MKKNPAANTSERQQPELPASPIAVDAAQAARLLGLSRNSVYKLAKAGDIPWRPAGRRMVFSVKALEEWAADPTAWRSRRVERSWR